MTWVDISLIFLTVFCIAVGILSGISYLSLEPVVRQIDPYPGKWFWLVGLICFVVLMLRGEV